MRARAHLALESVTVDLPLYSGAARSLSKSFLRRGAGGQVEVDGKRRLSVRALDSVSLQVGHGSRLGVLGHNGAGKTTLLRVLAGVYEPTRGTVCRIGRTTAVLSERLGMLGERTGYENIATRGLYLGLSRSQIRDYQAEVAEFTELGDYLELPLRTYSSGMKARLAFAASTCFDPEVLIMDEWLSFSDRAFLAKAERRLEEFIERAGIVVLAAHDHELLERVCSTGVLLEAGRVKARGPIDTLTRLL